MDVYTCPFCNKPWGGLPCVICKKPTCSPHNCELHVPFEWRRRNRMQCCGVDIHSRCKQAICPACGSGPTEKHDFTMFVMLRREKRRRGEMKIRDERYESEHHGSGLPIVPATPQCTQSPFNMVVNCPLSIVTQITCFHLYGMYT